jgi:KUP system potassium uptake protein
MLGCVGLVIGFQTSGNLAAAYGIAVTTTMAITTLLFYRVLLDRWFWSKAKALAVILPILFVDLAFLGANLPKIPHGGWFPLVVGLGLVVQMTTWRRGRALVAQIIRRGQRPLDGFIEEIRGRVARVPGTAIYMFKQPGAAPPAMISNLTHNRVLHATTIVLSIATTDAPRVAESDRAVVTRVTDGVYQVVLSFGFADEPDVLQELRRVQLEPDRPIDVDEATFFLGRETVTSTPAKSMSRWREELFVLLNRGAASASRFYRLPSNQVFEVGTQVDI